jgi:hypothetical protein
MQCARAVSPSTACLALQYFSTLSYKRHDFPEKVIESKTYVLILSTNLLETSIILKRTERDMIINVHMSVFMLIILYACPNLMNIEFSRQILEKCSNIKFHENPSIGRRIVLCGQTGRRDETNSSLSQF